MNVAVKPKLAIVGAGSLGQTYAGLLAVNGQPVTLFASPATAAALQRATVIRLRGAVTHDIPVAAAPARPGLVGVTSDPRSLPEGCGLIFATKGHQLSGAIEMVRSAWPTPSDSTGWVAGVQNGIVKDDLLANAFGAERVVGAVTILAGRREPTGEVIVTSLGMTYLGEFSGQSSSRVTEAIDVLRAAGIPAEQPPDIRSALWSKACNATGIFGVSVLARLGAGSFMRNPDLMRAYLALVRETADIAAANGVTVGDYAGFPIGTYIKRTDDETIAAIPPAPSEPKQPAGPTSQSMPSMTQDLLAGRHLEVEEIFGDMVNRAERAGVPAPRLTLVRDLIRGLDRLQG